MKVVLEFSPPNYDKFGWIGANLYYLLDPNALLIPETEITFKDKDTDKPIDLVVDHWEYHPEENLLCLHVRVDEGTTDETPEEFRRYMEEEWIGYKELIAQVIRIEMKSV